MTVHMESIVASIGVHFKRGLEGEDLADRIKRDFPAISSTEYVEAAQAAWAQMCTAGELQVRRIEGAKYSVWFSLASGHAIRLWEGDEHWEAALFAVSYSQKYSGAKVVDQVTGEVLLANPRP
jgi:hypothetical protein